MRASSTYDDALRSGLQRNLSTSMSLYIQYHNADKEGLKSLLADDGRFAIYTRLSHVQKARGTVFLIVGVGKPRQYFLWETFEIDQVEPQNNGIYHASGSGWRLCPPQRLEGDDFDAFKKSCANFVGFRKIDDLPYSITLNRLAERFHRPASAAMIPFLRELLGLLKDGTDDHETVLSQLSQRGGSQIADKRPSRSKPATRKPVHESQSSKSTIWLASSPPVDQPIKNLRALSIRQPHAEAIMRGIKKIEFRSRPTKIRGRVQIYASLKRYPAEDEAWMLSKAKYGMLDIVSDSLPRGVLIGTVEISDCTEKDGEFNWHLRNPERATRLLKPKKQPQPVWFNPF